MKNEEIAERSVDREGKKILDCIAKAGEAILTINQIIPLLRGTSSGIKNEYIK
jgi:ACT domain-containing protein